MTYYSFLYVFLFKQNKYPMKPHTMTRMEFLNELILGICILFLKITKFYDFIMLVNKFIDALCARV